MRLLLCPEVKLHLILFLYTLVSYLSFRVSNNEERVEKLDYKCKQIYNFKVKLNSEIFDITDSCNVCTSIIFV